MEAARAENPGDPGEMEDGHPAASMEDLDAVMERMPPPPPRKESDEPLLKLEEAVDRVPAELRREMEELLRAEFREVQRWNPRDP